MLAERLGVTVEDCLMVDDSISALESAKKSGIYTVGIYDDFSKDNESQIRALVHRYIHGLEELL
jgi:beta-phosphoglucomutase-like phosphatase (HAD superfamily)